MNSNNVFQMRTNEENRVKSDRQIPLNIVDIMYEILGNMSGYIRKLHYDEHEQILYTYHNDSGFSEKDEEAILWKNSSGDNSNTVGLNGFGARLAIDRLLPIDKRCHVISINTSRKCTIGHFDYTPWEHCDLPNELTSILHKMKINDNTGSLFMIPFKDEYHDLYMKEQEMLRRKSLLMLNIKIDENRVQFYWNNELQNVAKICPDEGCVTLNVDLGYDSKSELLHENHKKPLLMCINNYEQLDDSIKTILPSKYIILGKNTMEYKLEYYFRSFENLTMSLNTVASDTNPCFSEKEQDGFLFFFNDECMVHKPLIKGLQIQHGTEIAKYGGKPRFSMHITKTSKMYFIPTDKSNIKETTKGEHIHKFVHQFGIKYFTRRNNIIEPQIEDNSDEDNSDEDNSDEDNSDEDNSDEDNSDVTQDISPLISTTETSSSVNIFADISSNVTANQENDKKERKDFLTSTKDKALLQYQNNKAFIYGNSYNGPDRCPCCDRILKRSHQDAGHINSDAGGGSTDLDNCLIICRRCNNNDPRPIPQMMIEEWGLNHVNTIRVEKYLIHMNKQGKDIISNKRERQLENQFISQT